MKKANIDFLNCCILRDDIELCKQGNRLLPEGNVTFGEKLTLQKLCESCTDDKNKKEGGREWERRRERE